MGKIWMPGNGMGTGSDDCTAGKAQVLSGATAVTRDSDDEAMPGTMPNRGAWKSWIGVNGKAVIPEGYHNGSGYVDQAIATMGGQAVTPSTGQQTVGTSGKYMTGNVVVNPIPNQRGAGTKGVGCGDNGNIYFYIPTGYYLADGSGNSWVYMTKAEVANMLGLTAAKIKKGITVCGVTGTFEGWVPTATDLYVRGQNPGNVARFSGNISFESGGIRFTDTSSRGIKFTRNFAGFTRLNLEIYVSSLAGATNNSRAILDNDSGMGSVGQNGYETIVIPTVGNRTISFGLTNLQMNQGWAVKFIDVGANSWIYRVWLS